jgi:hypothetical protein
MGFAGVNTLSPPDMVFEVCLTALDSGRWEWRVCCERTAVLRGDEPTRGLAQLRGYDDLFFLLSLGPVVILAR